MTKAEMEYLEELETEFNTQSFLKERDGTGENEAYCLAALHLIHACITHHGTVQFYVNRRGKFPYVKADFVVLSSKK